MIIDFPQTQHIPGLQALWQEGFQDPPEFIDTFFRCAFSPRRCLCVLQQDQPIAALYWFDCHWQEKPLAYVYAVVTAKPHQGQGLCHKLMEQAQKTLQQQGYEGIVLVPAKQELFGFYAGMGYRTFGGIARWECVAAQAAIPLKPLTSEEYAITRKAYLPENSVLQEGVTMQLLDTYADFYAGADFILCAAQEKGKLIGYELLGNREAAAGILTALGLQSGSFRAPGDAPFAMFRSLTDDPALPDYFAFALD